MQLRTKRNYFIAKHGLDSLTELPGYIWRTGFPHDKIPHRFTQVKTGDRWIAFAYTSSDRRERRLSHITGFYECTQAKRHGRIPLPAATLDRIVDGERKAWMISGKPYGEQPRQPVGVRPIDGLLHKSTFKNQTLIPIEVEDFERIQKETLRREFDTGKIPLLAREPNNEQELLAIVVYGHKQLGVEEIIRVRKAFPDLLVRVKGCSKEVHLELELYSDGFISHGHDSQVHDRRFREDRKDVAVLCWIDNDHAHQVKKRVHRIYELQSLIRDGSRIVW